MKNLFIALTIAFPLLAQAQNEKIQPYLCYRAEVGAGGNAALGAKLGVAKLQGDEITLPGEKSPANFLSRGLQVAFDRKGNFVIARTDNRGAAAICLKAQVRR